MSLKAFQIARLILVVTGTLVCSCDLDAFGTDSKNIGGGYRLSKWGEGSPGFVLFSSDGIGESTTDIGWQKPLILVQNRDAEKHPNDWIVIDTTTGEKLSITDEQRRTEEKYRAIRIYSAEHAWDLLRKRREW